jgi:hypothetical protein
MSDTTEIAPVDESPEATAAAETAKQEKAPKVIKQPEACACSRFLLQDDKDVAEGESGPLFDTECTATTMRVFAQGHDARLVSFLVNGEHDGLTVLENRNGVHLRYDGATHAANSISQALGAKAEAAIARLRAAQAVKDERQAKIAEGREAKAAEKAAKKVAADQAKAEKKAAAEAAKAAKAAAPKAVAGNVVPGSQTGDVPEGFVRIKVGRGEYDAIQSEVDGKQVVTYRNLRGEEETRDLDLVRVLS